MISVTPFPPSATTSGSTAASDVYKENLAAYTLTVTVSDGTTTVTADDIAITIPDVATAITAAQSASVAESASIGDAVLTVATTDGVDDNDFAITAGNTGTAFAIDASSGAITTATSVHFQTLAAAP